MSSLFDPMMSARGHRRHVRLALFGTAVLGSVLACGSCGEKSKVPKPQPPVAGQTQGPMVVARVGNIEVTESDVVQWITDQGGNPSDEAMRRQSIESLQRMAQSSAEALKLGLWDDPSIKQGIGRLLSNRLRQLKLQPLLSEADKPIHPDELKREYEARISRYSLPEMRQVALLWLNPGADPERRAAYVSKIEHALEWMKNTPEILDHPEQGFSVMSVDSSEHSASRYQGGVLDWIKKDDPMADEWLKVVANAAFALSNPGDTSGVINSPQGVFAVRLVAIRRAFHRPLEEVAEELDRDLRRAKTAEIEQHFEESLRTAHPAVRQP
jgi:hypothetical protein